MSSTYSASSGGPPAAAAEPRRIRRAVALPSAEDPAAGPTSAQAPRGAVAGMTVPAASGARTVPSAPSAVSRPVAPQAGDGPSDGRRLHLADPERSPASEPAAATAEGLPGGAAVGRRAGAPPASRAVGGRRTGGKPLLVAAAVAGAVLATVPFVSKSDGRTTYEGLGQQVPVASQSPEADGGGASGPDGGTSVLPLQDPADGVAAPVVPQPRATEGEQGSEATAPSSSTPSSSAGEAGPRQSDGPLYGPPLPSASGKDVPGRGGVLGAGTVGLTAGDRSRTTSGTARRDGASGTTGATTESAARAVRPGTVVKASAPSKAASSGTARSSSGTASADSAQAAAPVKATATPVKATATPVKATATPVKATATPVKATATPVKAVAAKRDWGTRVVSATTVLGPGRSVASDRMTITMRTDGDLVITDENGTVRWSSHTRGTGYKAVFQDDGHFVVYGQDNRTAWSSGTAGNPGAQLVIQADGNVTVMSAGGAVLWSANTQH
ncbi:hypothetical protein [Streptomyces sp. SAI-229]|uniref:hypothetical protein n=1 Tax=Streptomyces sp. SAI-229 TaxID=3377731 RepID=UPI003C7BC7E5